MYVCIYVTNALNIAILYLNRLDLQNSSIGFNTAFKLVVKSETISLINNSYFCYPQLCIAVQLEVHSSNSSE